MLALLILGLAGPQESEFSEILKRFDADDPALRDAASKRLDAFADKLGPEAIPFLKRELERAKGEVRARLDEKLKGLARIESCRRMLGFLEAFDAPSCKGRRLVIFNTGEMGWSGTPENVTFRYVLGWVISESREEMVLLDRELRTTRHPRNRATAPDWERVREKQPIDHPPPGEAREVELSRMCSDLMEATRAEARDGVGFFHRSENAWTLTPAVFAHWCLQRGLGKTALELVELGESVWRSQAGDDEKMSYAEVLVGRGCESLRHQAIDTAEGRPEILKKWRAIGKLSPGFRDHEAQEMIRLYEKLIEEDAAWKELPAADLAKREPAARAEVWVHLLRDVAARQWSDPGACHVFSPLDGRGKGIPYPPDELVKLGWEAIPALIEHLDDARPTRSVGWHRSFNPSSYYLLRVGDCCEQILEKITGASFYRRRSTSGAMVKDGEASTVKQKAREWWRENEKVGAEAYFVKSLEDPVLAGMAAEKLLAMNPAKHLPKLLGILESGPRGPRNSILGPIGPHLGKEHEKHVEAVLGDPDGRAMMSAARILWERWGSDRGALEVVAKLKALDGDDRDSAFTWGASQVLRGIRTESVAKGLSGLMDAKNTRARMESFRMAGAFPHPLLAAALVRQLEDKTPTGWSSSYPIRFCDEAAGALAGLVGLGERFALKGSDEERDAVIGNLKAWWEKEGGAVDWSALRQKVEKAELPTPDPKE